ncbi:LysR family transcriptional regulator [Actinokineospora sp. UTMC 2448]|uniref:LysR family transcriptional regulator n=1 Tax=Actinokineospora sp. UTMC 2448 TaxID=2268449 RepID=UPI002164E301|nr:LysR family transcriptional regulator [Actinokineospora sp. UTMC 2448]
MMDLRQLSMFRVVVEQGSFSAAARALHCTQPAVSQQMKALERSVGGPLFIRVGRGLRLTEAGTALSHHAKEILDGAASAHQRVRAIAASELDSIRLCAFPSANAALVPRAAAKLRQDSPGLRLELLEHEPPDSHHALRRAECDLVVAFTYPAADRQAADDGLLEVPLLDEPLMLLVPADHPMARRSPAVLAELAGETWIAGCPRCRDEFVTACADSGFEPAIACATDDNLAIQALVAAGLGVAMVPALVLSSLRHPDVVALPIDPLVRRRVSAYTWPDLVRSATIRSVIEALRAAATQLPGIGMGIRGLTPAG